MFGGMGDVGDWLGLWSVLAVILALVTLIAVHETVSMEITSLRTKRNVLRLDTSSSKPRIRPSIPIHTHASLTPTQSSRPK